jgi:hypothetical protein
MKSRNVPRWIAAPFTGGGVWWVTDYLRHGHPILLAVGVWIGGIGLALVGLLLVVGLLVSVFPRLGPRLSPWLAAKQRRERGAS